MIELDNYKLLSDMVEQLQDHNMKSTNKISVIRSLIKIINDTKNDLLLGNIELSDDDIDNYKKAVDNAILGNNVNLMTNIETTVTLENMQLGGFIDDINLEFTLNSIEPPEHGSIIQKLWEVRFSDNTTGHVIISDASDIELSTLVNAQLSTALSTAPNGAVEDLDITVSLSDLEQIINNNSRNISNLIVGLEKPGLVARQLRDIDINNDPELQFLTNEQKNNLINAVNILNSAQTEQEKNNAQNNLQSIATNFGLYSTSLGPTPNFDYSDLKRFRLQKDQNTIVTVTLSMPVVSWGELVHGIPLRDINGLKNKTNRKDDGKCYIVDLGGIDPVIRNGTPNPLPATKFYNNGPSGATETEGVMDRYKGGKCVGMNTTENEVSFSTVHRESDGEIILTIPPLTALWQLDRSSFDLTNRHAYYTVFSASRAPPAGFMGVVLAPKQNRVGRGKGEIASGVTLANGISKTGQTFNIQDENGPILDNNNEIPSNLKGLTCNYDGHALDPKDFLKFLQDNSFIKGTQYLTIPSNATIETVQDILIPSGQFVPQITQAVGTLNQFGNGKFIQDGGPNRFQSGLIPFLPGTNAYTPEWHINFVLYNCGDIECEGNTYHIENVALDEQHGSWIKPNHNASFSLPGPNINNINNSKESGFSPAFPDTFDPVQLRCGIKNSECLDYINKLNGSKNGEISLSMLQSLENDNKILLTEAPSGALRGWVKFLVVNCPLPVIATINVIGEEQIVDDNDNDPNTGTCISCTCDRTASTLSINGDLIPIWLDEDSEGNDTSIGDRVLKFKVGDNIVIRSTSGTMHGVALRLDNMQSNITIDNNKTLEIMQNEVLEEIKDKLVINNEQDLENNMIALSDSLMAFHGGVPITFAEKATLNPVQFPDGVIIADFTVKDGAQNSSGTVSCTIHGVAMSFIFSVCSE